MIQMNDIVERLRNPIGHGVMHQEAADEIERLRKEWLRLYAVERMRFEAVQKITAEIERLQTRVRELEEELGSRLAGTVWLDGAVEKDGDA